MNDDDLEKSLVDWVIDVPASRTVFEECGLDYSCAGKSLEYVCRQRGIHPEDVLAKIRRAVADSAER
jgi:regulator of cell morphogenesis and NO signaling